MLGSHGALAPAKSFGIISLKCFPQDQQLFSHPNLHEVNEEQAGSPAFLFVCSCSGASSYLRLPLCDVVGYCSSQQVNCVQCVLCSR